MDTLTKDDVKHMVNVKKLPSYLPPPASFIKHFNSLCEEEGHMIIDKDVKWIQLAQHPLYK